MAEHAKPENYLDQQCAKCGKEFRVHKSQVAAGNGRYCSRACARSGSPTRKRAPVVLQCKTCAKWLERYPADMKKSRGKQGFCSLECWYSFNQRDNHYLWSGGQNDRMNPEGVIWRRAVLKQDKFHCRICHAPRKLEAHHILPFRSHKAERWDLSNGITLCQSCHRKIGRDEVLYAETLRLIASVPLVVWKT